MLQDQIVEWIAGPFERVDSHDFWRIFCAFPHILAHGYSTALSPCEDIVVGENESTSDKAFDGADRHGTTMMNECSKVCMRDPPLQTLLKLSQIVLELLK